MAGLIMACDVMLNRTVSNQETGFLGPLNSPETTLTLNDGTETVERKSNKRDSLGQVLDSVVFPGKTLINITLDDADPDVMELFLLGDQTAIAIEAGSVSAGTPESITAHLNRFSRLAHRHVSSVVVKDATDTTTYVLGTDYEVEAVTGMIKAIGSTIQDDDVLHVSYSYAAQTGTQITGSTQTEIRCQVLLDGKNLANQKQCEVYAAEAVLTPNGDVKLIGGREYWQGTLSGTLVTPDGESGPYTYKEID